MAECRRCGRDTDRRTLDNDPLCAECAEWHDEHEKSREADQSQRNTTVAMQAASRDWSDASITLPNDQLAIVTHPPVTAADGRERKDVSTSSLNMGGEADG